MGFCSIVFLNCIIPLLFYTLFILKIPHSNSIRLEIKSMSLCYIKSFPYFKNHNYGRNFERDRMKSNFLVQGTKVDEILENLKGLTLLETSELIKKIEETFGVSAQALPQGPLALTTQTVAPDQPFKEEEDEGEDPVLRNKKRSHTVVITAITKEKFIESFRVLREFYPDKSAVEIKKIMDNLPYTVKTVNTKREAEDLIKKLQQDGMTIEIQ